MTECLSCHLDDPRKTRRVPGDGYMVMQLHKDKRRRIKRMALAKNVEEICAAPGFERVYMTIERGHLLLIGWDVTEPLLITNRIERT